MNTAIELSVEIDRSASMHLYYHAARVQVFIAYQEARETYSGKVTIAGIGEDEFLDIHFESPEINADRTSLSTFRFLATQVCRRLAGSAPSDDMRDAADMAAIDTVSGMESGITPVPGPHLWEVCADETELAQ
jgi:hypothetical protein